MAPSVRHPPPGSHPLTPHTHPTHPPHHRGHLSRQNGFYEYGVSPYQLRPFAGFFSPGAANLARRTGGQLAFILPPALFFYYLAGWSDKQVGVVVPRVCAELGVWVGVLVVDAPWQKLLGHRVVRSSAHLPSPFPLPPPITVGDEQEKGGPGRCR